MKGRNHFLLITHDDQAVPVDNIFLMRLIGLEITLDTLGELRAAHAEDPEKHAAFTALLEDTRVLHTNLRTYLERQAPEAGLSLSGLLEAVRDTLHQPPVRANFRENYLDDNYISSLKDRQ